MQKLYLTDAQCSGVYRHYGFIPQELSAALSGGWAVLPYNLLTVFTSLFLHGGVLHIVGNMLYLWIFGTNVEDAMGHRRFIVFYFMSGALAATFQFFYDPYSAVPMVGASGAVAGVLGAYLVLYPFAKVKTILVIVILIKVVELPAILLLSIWFIMQVLFAYQEGVAWYAHIGGFLFGLVAVKLFTRKTGRRRK